MFHFADNDVVIPIYVLEEIDHFKKELSERGRNAREVARRLDEFRNLGQSLSEGVALENKGRLMVALASRPLPDTLKATSSQDNNILGVALEVRDRVRRSSDGARHQGRQPAHPRRRARPQGRGVQRREDRRRGALLGQRRGRSAGVGGRSVLRRGRAVDRRHRRAERVLRQPIFAAARSREPFAHRARALRRAEQEGGAGQEAARRRVGHSPAQQGAALRARPAARTTRSSWSRSSARRARARRCWPSPPACRSASRRACTRSCWCRARSSRSAGTSAFCPATSRRSSTRGCSRSTTTSSCCSASSKRTRRKGARTRS